MYVMYANASNNTPSSRGAHFQCFPKGVGYTIGWYFFSKSTNFNKNKNKQMMASVHNTYVKKTQPTSY